MEKKGLGRVLFKEYGISEWDEKCVILSGDEKISILNAIKNGENNLLVDIVRLPYPKFITEYIKLYRSSLDKREDKIIGLHDYLMQESDKYYDLGYKLYVMPTKLTKLVVKYIKNPDENISQIIGTNYHGITFMDIILFLSQPLEHAYKSFGTQSLNKEAIKKYLHIMSYVDETEAEMLGLTGFTFKKYDVYRGFGLDEKLDALNPLIRCMVEENLGLNGVYMNLTEIESKLNINHILNDLFTDEFYLALSRSVGEFKNYIRLIEKDYESDDRRTYANNTPFRIASDRVETSFIRNYLKSIGLEIPQLYVNSRSSANYLSSVYSAQIGKEIPFEGVK